MTKEDKVKACEMRMDGYTVREIAEKFSVSPQYISYIFSDLSVDRRRKRQTGNFKYPNLGNWMDINHISQRKLAEMTGVSPPTVNKFLLRDGNMRMSTIKKILQVTGMTFEEAFKERDHDQERKEA